MLKKIPSKLQNFIERNSVRYKSITDFLLHLHKIPKSKRLRFMNTLFSDKTKLIDCFNYFSQSFEKREDFLNWYFEIYLKVYNEWFEALFASSSIEKCIELIPNITPWAFERKCTKLEIGEVPKSFGSKDNFLLLIDKILSSDAVVDLKKIKDLEVTSPEKLLSAKQLAGKKADALAEKTKVIKQLLKKNMDHSFKIAIQNLTFLIQPLFNPLSNKLAVRIKTQDKKSFILKVSLSTEHAFLSDQARKNHENQLLRADSPYSNAIVDFYLKFNNCPMSADVLYYNFNYDAVLYLETKGRAYHFPNGKHIYPNMLEFNIKHAKEMTDLGLFINDINEANFILSPKTKRPVLIDNGHVSYVNPLNPGHPGLTFTIGNLSGRDSICQFGVILCQSP